jgi:hypothetical protein
MHGVGRELPGSNVLVVPQAGQVRSTAAAGFDGRGFGDEEPRSGALLIVGRNQLIGLAIRTRASARGG